MKPRELPDDALLARIARRDQHAFRALYDRYYRRLFGYVYRITRRPELVDEVLNETMLTVWQKARTFEGRSRPSSWILGIAYRLSLKSLRTEKRRSSEPPESEPPEPAPGPESLMVQRERATHLGRALARLSPEQRAVVELTYFEELSYREIAAIVDCPVNTVKTRMFWARRKLREILPALGVDGGGGTP